MVLFMSYKAYEKFGSVHVLLFIICLIVIFSVISLFTVSKIRKYSSITGVVTLDNQAMFILSSSDLSWLYHNNNVFFDGYKTKFSIDRVNSDIVKIDGKKYHQVFLNLNLKKKYKENETIVLALYQRSDSFITTFFTIWKGEL